MSNTIGKILDGPGPKDAVHIAIVPVMIGEEGLEAGTPIRIMGGRAYRAGWKSIGIIDPFIDRSYLFEGMWVNMFLHPASVEDIRHEWTLAEYDNNVQLVDTPRLDPTSVEWLKKFASRHNTSYDALVNMCQEALLSNEDDPYITFYGTDIHEVPEGFWNYFKLATGFEVPPEKANKIEFSCSC